MEGFELLLSAAEILENSGETTLTVPDDSFPNETAEASFVRVTTSTPCRPKDGEKSQQDIQPRLSGERSPRNGSGRNYHPGSSSGGRDPRREYHYYKDASWHRSNNRSPRDERYLGDNTRRTPSRGSPSHRSRGGLPRDESNRGDDSRRAPPRGISPHLDRYSQRRSHDRTHQDESQRGHNTRRSPSRRSPSRRSRDRSPREESYRGGNTRRTPSRGSPSRRSRDRLPRDGSYRGDDSRRAPPRGTSPHLDRYSQRRSHDRTHQDEGYRGGNNRRTPSRGSYSRRSRDRLPRDESYRGDDSRRAPPRGTSPHLDRYSQRRSHDRTHQDEGYRGGNTRRTPSRGSPSRRSRDWSPREESYRGGNTRRTPSRRSPSRRSRDRLPRDESNRGDDSRRAPPRGTSPHLDRYSQRRSHDRTHQDEGYRGGNTRRTPSRGSPSRRSRDWSPREESYRGGNTRRTPSRRSPSRRSRDRLPRDESNRGDDSRRAPPRGTSPHLDRYSQRRSHDRTHQDEGYRGGNTRRTPSRGSPSRRSRDWSPREESYRGGNTRRTPSRRSPSRRSRDRLPRDESNRGDDSRRAPPRGTSPHLDRYSQRRSHDRTHQDEGYRGGNTRRTPSRGSPSRRSRDWSPREESYRGGNTRRTPSRRSPSRRSRDRLPRDESNRGDDSRRAPPRGTSPHPDSYSQRRSRDVLPRGESYSRRTPPRGSSQYLDRYSQRRSHDRTHQDVSYRGGNTRRTPSRGSPSRRSRDRLPRDESNRGDDSRRAPPRGISPHLDRYSQRRSHDRTHQDESQRGHNTRRSPSRRSPSRRSRDRSPWEESYRGGNTRRTPSRGSPSRRSRDRLPRDESNRGDDSRRVPPRGSPSGRSHVRSPQGESSLDRGVLIKERHVEIFQRVASPEIPSPAFSPLSNPKQIELDPDYDPEDDLDDDAHPTDLDDFSIFEIFEEYRNISLFLPEPEAAAGEEKLDDAEAGEEKTDGFENDLGFEEVCDVEFKKTQADKPLTNKVKRERGLSYATYRGNIMPARSVKDPCHCAKLQCYTKYDDSMRQTLLQNLLKLPRSGQDQFIANHLEVLPVQNHRVINSRRNYSYKYFLPGIGGRVRVCLEMFLSTLDLGEKKVRILAGRLITGSGVCGVDGRLLNRNRNALEPEERKYIEDHIRSFPAYTSHLGREKSSKLYLSSELNIAKMHQLYVQKCLQNGKQAICYNTYRLVFRTFKLGFIKPKLDRCNDCEKFRTALKVAENDTHRSNIRDAREKHQAAAKAVYNAKKADVTRAKSHKTICTASFDLQKCLPTPHLRCGMAYYKRQLYTLNLTVFYTINGKNGAKCFLWNETLARRGSQEIASCVYQFIGQILDEYPSVTEFIFYSDRCGGQNLNFTLCMMFSFVAEKYSREKLNVTLRHNFMVSGHSHMEVDSVHAAIEKAKKSTSIDIEIPRDWAVFIAQIKRKVPLEVIELDQTKFIEFKQLEDRYKKPKIDSAGNPIKLKTIYSFEYRSSEIGKVFYKLNVDNDSLRVFDIGKVDQLISSDLVLPAPIETEPIKLSQEKLSDLKSLLPFIQNKAYYETMLKTLSAPKRGRKIKVVDDNCFDNDMDWDDDENLDE